MKFASAGEFEWPASPVDLVESKVGDYEVRHRNVHQFDVVSFREALLTGRKPQRVRLVKPLRIHELVLGTTGTLMTDLPIELRQMWEQIDQLRPRGRVLVGGLGLGIVAEWLSHWPGVTAVDVWRSHRKSSPWRRGPAGGPGSRAGG